MRTGDLLRASHPVPGAAVTAFAAALTRAAGGDWPTTARTAAAVGAGQLALGWANDAVDAEVDRRAGRTDKPVAAGRLSRGGVAVAALGAAAAAVPLSAALGPRAGRLHLVALAAGLTYDVGVKGTWASPLPYLAFFGALPAVAARAAGARTPLLLCGVGATVGLAGHLANTVPDAAADAATGVRGLPQLLGPTASRAGAGALVVLADAVVLLRARSALGPASRVLLGAAAVTGVAGAVGGGAASFRAVLAAAGLTVAGALASGRQLLRG